MLLRFSGILLVFATGCLYAQRPDHSFCGWKYSDTGTIRKGFQKPLSFLNISDGDTIADIGSASGAFEGSLSVIGNFRDVHFVLVDIDSTCLNRTSVNNMLDYYGRLKGIPLGQQFTIVNNTPDSLYLAKDKYRHIWLFNTLHEIPDKQKIIRDIAAVLVPGGELVLEEVLSSPGHTIHGGCHKPLLREDEIVSLFERNGFTKKEMMTNPGNVKKPREPVVMIRFLKL